MYKPYDGANYYFIQREEDIKITAFSGYLCYTICNEI